MDITVQGDLYIDAHYTVKDTAMALENKRDLCCFGFGLPMDEYLAHCTLDIYWRPYLEYKAEYSFQRVGDNQYRNGKAFLPLPFLLPWPACCTCRTKGKNNYHQVESLFKAFGRTLIQAIRGR